MQNVDVAIVGGGMVGLALACGLQGSGLRVTVLEQQSPESFNLQEPPKLRVSAINGASEALLRRVGAWEKIEALRLSPYHSMEVWDRDSFGRIAFDGSRLGFNRLGHIIENAVIHQALWEKVLSCDGISLAAPVSIQQIAWGENEAFLALDDGVMLTARLVVGADGAHSWLRQRADIPLTTWDYGHHALIATVRTAEAHQGVARQVFHGDGILAFLPLCDPHLCSIVWSLAPNEAEQMRQTEPDAFNRALSAAFDMRLGLCHLESDRQTFPLTGRYARQFAGHRVALLGDAAHTIHPLAGQGVNLGFMDAAELIAEIRRLHTQGKDIGQHLYLRRYERRRKHSAALMLAGMQGFRELFAGSHPAKKLMRDIGLKLADTLPGVKLRLIRQAMGLHDLPDWLR